MELEGVQLLVTVFGSAVAAVAAVLNLIFTLRKRVDRIKVRLGPATASFGEGDYLHIINCSEHEVRLSDYGFVIKHENRFTFHSIPIETDYGYINSAEVSSNGKPLIQPRDYFEVCYPGDKRTIACYGKTINMSKTQLSWLASTPYLDRIRIRSRLLFNQHPLSWD